MAADLLFRTRPRLFRVGVAELGAAFGHRVFVNRFPIALILPWATTSQPVKYSGNANDIGARGRTVGAI